MFTNIFRSSIRRMAAIGRGDLLIKWAHFAGDASAYGEVMKKVIRVVGHLVDSDFKSAEALAAELEYIAGLSPDGEFLFRVSSMVRANIFFARGDFERTTQSLNIALSNQESEASLENLIYLHSCDYEHAKHFSMMILLSWQMHMSKPNHYKEMAITN